jgi:peptide/nickel transport system substrate-binding protein
VIFRFVSESATRVADLTTGTAQIVSDIPLDQLQAIEDAGHTVITTPIVGTTFIRIATDAAPFDDPRVRQALNYGVDVQTIADAIVGPDTHRLASFFPDPRGLGFDESLAPFPYDPERARELLAEANLADGFDAEIEVVASSRTDVVEAVVAQLAEVGVRLRIVATELAAFNQGWPNPESPALRFASWRPMYDPHTFLSLVVDSEGFLSRFENVEADELIRAATIEPDADVRKGIYQELGALLQEEPAGIYLWNATASYGVTDEFLHWTPRGDQYIVPTNMSGDRT